MIVFMFCIYRPQTKFEGKVIFSEASVILFIGGLCIMLLPVFLSGPMFFLGGLCPWSHVPSRGSLSRKVSVQVGSLSRGLCAEGVPV